MPRYNKVTNDFINTFADTITAFNARKKLAAQQRGEDPNLVTLPPNTKEARQEELKEVRRLLREQFHPQGGPSIAETLAMLRKDVPALPKPKLKRREIEARRQLSNRAFDVLMDVCESIAIYSDGLVRKQGALENYIRSRKLPLDRFHAAYPKGSPEDQETILSEQLTHALTELKTNSELDPRMITSYSDEQIVNLCTKYIPLMVFAMEANNYNEGKHLSPRTVELCKDLDAYMPILSYMGERLGYISSKLYAELPPDYMLEHYSNSFDTKCRDAEEEYYTARNQPNPELIYDYYSVCDSIAEQRSRLLTTQADVNLRSVGIKGAFQYRTTDGQVHEAKNFMALSDVFASGEPVAVEMPNGTYRTFTPDANSLLIGGPGVLFNHKLDDQVAALNKQVRDATSIFSGESQFFKNMRTHLQALASDDLNRLMENPNITHAEPWIKALTDLQSAAAGYLNQKRVQRGVDESGNILAKRGIESRRVALANSILEFTKKKFEAMNLCIRSHEKREELLEHREEVAQKRIWDRNTDPQILRPEEATMDELNTRATAFMQGKTTHKNLGKQFTDAQENLFSAARLSNYSSLTPQNKELALDAMAHVIGFSLTNQLLTSKNNIQQKRGALLMKQFEKSPDAFIKSIKNSPLFKDMTKDLTPAHLRDFIVNERWSHMANRLMDYAASRTLLQPIPPATDLSDAKLGNSIRKLGTTADLTGLSEEMKQQWGKVDFQTLGSFASQGQEEKNVGDVFTPLAHMVIINCNRMLRENGYEESANKMEAAYLNNPDEYARSMINDPFFKAVTYNLSPGQLRDLFVNNRLDDISEQLLSANNPGIKLTAPKRESLLPAAKESPENSLDNSELNISAESFLEIESGRAKPPAGPALTGNGIGFGFGGS